MIFVSRFNRPIYISPLMPYRITECRLSACITYDVRDKSRMVTGILFNFITISLKKVPYFRIYYKVAIWCVSIIFGAWRTIKCPRLSLIFELADIRYNPSPHHLNIF